MQAASQRPSAALDELNASDLYDCFIKAIRPVLRDIMSSYRDLENKMQNSEILHITDFPDHERKSLLFVEYCLDFTAYLNIRLKEKDDVLQKSCLNMQSTIDAQLEHASSKLEADARKRLRFTTLYAKMDTDLGIFGKNTILSDIIDEFPYIFWLLTILQEFVLHMSHMLQKIAAEASQKQIQTHETDPDDAASAQICHGTQKRIWADEIDDRIRSLTISGQDISLMTHSKLEQLFISRGMLSFLKVLEQMNHQSTITQDNCMQLWNISIDSISQQMLAQARLRFGEQRNVYGLRDGVRLRRVKSPLGCTNPHDMLHNNYPGITLQNVDYAHHKFNTLLTTIMSSVEQDTTLNITFDFSFMAFLCPPGQPIQTYDTTSVPHHNPSRTNSISTLHTHTRHIFGANHEGAFGYKIVQCKQANHVLLKISTNCWSPIDTKLPKQPVLIA